MNSKKKILTILTTAVLLSILISPLIFADPDNVIEFKPTDIHMEIGSSTVMNINVTINEDVDTVAVDNMTFNGSVVTTESANVTSGNLFENGSIDDIVTVDNTNGYISSIVWANETLTAVTTGILANITWYASGCGVSEIQMTAGGTAYNGTANATTNHSCNITVHPQDPSAFSSQVNDTTTIYLTWSNNLGADNAVLVGKNASYPTDYTDGTILLNASATHYEDTVPAGEHWYYRIYGWNTTASLYSLYNQTTNADSSSSLTITNPYPANTATEISRPPANLSADVGGVGIDAYIYFVNMTPTSNTWTLVNSWSDISSQRIEYTTLSTFGTTYEFKWGNTTYTWSVNITDGSSWVNTTYTYDTIESVSDGSDAWKDTEVDNSDVDVFDCIAVYNWYNDGNPYNGFFDIEKDNSDVDVFDVIVVYNEYS